VARCSYSGGGHGVWALVRVSSMRMRELELVRGLVSLPWSSSWPMGGGGLVRAPV
jgi:hypothetical protein